MKNNELFLVIGLTVLLSVVVSLATLKITGNAVVAWDDSIGGFPSKTSTTTQPAKFSTEQTVVNLFKNAEIRDGISTTSCQKRCQDAKLQCAVALFSDNLNGAQLISCGDKSKQHDNRQYKITCVCVSPSA